MLLSDIPQKLYRALRIYLSMFKRPFGSLALQPRG